MRSLPNAKGKEHPSVAFILEHIFRISAPSARFCEIRSSSCRNMNLN